MVLTYIRLQIIIVITLVIYIISIITLRIVTIHSLVIYFALCNVPIFIVGFFAFVSCFATLCRSLQLAYYMCLMEFILNLWYCHT